MGPLYIVTEQFTPAVGPAWDRYIEWSCLTQLTELVSLDSMLCPTVLGDIADDDWPYIVNENFMLNYFHDLEYLLGRVGDLRNRNVLCVYRNPDMRPSPPTDRFTFEFEGYDLVDSQGGPSALTNCGGFPKAFANAELSSHGLLLELNRAKEVQEALRVAYPDEHHADCHVWALFRAIAHAA